jgi:hypothetical protein
MAEIPKIGVQKKVITLKTANREVREGDFLVPYGGQILHNAVKVTIPEGHSAIATWWVPTGNIDELSHLSYIEVSLPDTSGPDVSVDLGLRGNAGKEALITITIYVMYQPD